MRSEVQALIDRWEGFLARVRERLGAVLAEADAGFDQIIATDVTDPASLAGAVSAFEARMRGLGQKIDEAYVQLSDEIASTGGRRHLDRLHAEGEALRLEIEQQTQEMSILKRASAARRLYQVAQQELGQSLSCPGCGGQLDRSHLHRPVNLACPYCGAINSVQPGLATTYYYSGNAIHALAEEQALPEGRALRQEERRFGGLARRTDEDRARLRAAFETYWRRYCTVYGELHPDWTPAQVETELRAKVARSMQGYEAW